MTPTPAAREIENDRRAEPARADDENTGLEELRLTRPADFGQHDVARVALDLFVAEFHASIIAALRAFRNRGAAARRSVSRVLCPREGATAIPLGRPSPDASCDLPGRRPRRRDPAARERRLPSLSGLAPGEACRAGVVAAAAVRSCRTLSPLPAGPPRRRSPGARGRFAFCGAVSRVAPAGRYPAPCLRGARTFLSAETERPSDRLTGDRPYPRPRRRSRPRRRAGRAHPGASAMLSSSERQREAAS